MHFSVDQISEEAKLLGQQPSLPQSGETANGKVTLKPRGLPLLKARCLLFLPAQLLFKQFFDFRAGVAEPGFLSCRKWFACRRLLQNVAHTPGFLEILAESYGKLVITAVVGLAHPADNIGATGGLYFFAGAAHPLTFLDPGGNIFAADKEGRPGLLVLGFGNQVIDGFFHFSGADADGA